MKRVVIVAAYMIALLVLTLAVRGSAFGARTPSPAVAQFAKAERSFTALRGNARAQRQRDNFTRVLEAYRRVFEKHPATREAEKSLLRAGELMTLLYRWTGQAGDLNRAQNYYQRLVQTSPKSPLVDDALLAIGYLYLDHFKDPAQAWSRFREVTRRTPGGDKAAEAKRQLKRLAAYAVEDKPDRAVDTADLTCPTPVPPAPPAPRSAGSRSTEPDAPVAARAGSTAAAGTPQALNRIRGIRHWSNPEYSRVVIDLDQKTNFFSNLLEDRSGGGKPPRLYVDLFGSLVDERFCRQIIVNDGILHGIRAGQYAPDSVRVVLDIAGLSTYRIFPMQDPFRIVIDVTGGEPGAAARAPSARVAPDSPAPAYTPAPVPELIPLPPTVLPPAESPRTAVAAPAPAVAPPASSAGASTRGSASPAATGAAPASQRGTRPGAGTVRVPGQPAPAGKPSLARQLGLGVRRVVIDAGHGAHDSGAIGVGGLKEKDVTLDLALRVRDLLQAAGYEVVLTRDRDVYLPLEERTAIANTARGDLFLSLHCNASDKRNLSGVETYFLNLASSVRSMQTAARENSMAVANMSDLQKIVREIENSKMDESSQFAARVQRSLYDTLRRRYADSKDLGVKQAPFYVLIGAQMPSVLAEVSFINHRKEGRRLADPATRQLIAQGLADGVKRYIRSVKTAASARPGKSTP